MEFTPKTSDCAIEVDYCQRYCEKKRIGGDVFLSKKIKEQSRVLAVLSDGLGSGVKAGVLATLTSVMGLNYMGSFRDPAKAAKSIMETLPVCSKRNISYSTFSMVDIDFDNEVRIVEYDNPPVLITRNGSVMDTQKQETDVLRADKEPVQINVSGFDAKIGDRIIMFSDGVSQSGIGSKELPFGWGIERVGKFILDKIASKPEISAHDLSRAIVEKSWLNNSHKALDDITCGVIYFRNPRRLLIMTGPPYDRQKDKMLASLVEEFPGKKIICGGTTANIISRETGRNVHVRLDKLNADLPPESIMDGADLVTEGILTIGRAAKYLEDKIELDSFTDDPGAKIVKLMLDSDVINFVVGTRINEFHQDPNMPVDLEIRRNVIKKISKLLEEQYYKETTIQYI